MTPQGLLASPQNEASRPILGRKDTDDQFPMDTGKILLVFVCVSLIIPLFAVHRIYTDIEKLFIDETDVSCYCFLLLPSSKLFFSVSAFNSLV